MNSVRRVFVAGFATLLLAGACTSINIPSIPPIPTLPPGFTIPPIPTIPPGFTIPPLGGPPIGSPSATPCQLVTAAEVSTIFGAQALDESDSSTDCTFQTTLTSALSVKTTNDTDFSAVGFLLGDTAQQSSIGGFPSVSGVFIGQQLLYVQKPTGQLQLLGILMGTDPAVLTQMQQVATIAIGRMP
jgi:hypothetical protein